LQPVTTTSCKTTCGYPTPPAARLEFLDGRTKVGDATHEGWVDTSEQVSPCLNGNDSNAETGTTDTTTIPTRYASPLFDPRHAEDALRVATPHPTTVQLPLPVSAITAARGRKPPTEGPCHDDARSKPPLDNQNPARLNLTSGLDPRQDPPVRKEATPHPRHQVLWRPWPKATRTTTKATYKTANTIAFPSPLVDSPHAAGHQGHTRLRRAMRAAMAFQFRLPIGASTYATGG
jgi:hypothetical protein